MKEKCFRLVFSLFFLLMSSGTAWAITIDFDGHGLQDGDAISSLGIVSFDGSAAVQGGGGFAFISPAGNDTGNSGSFSTSGNTFITNLGGVGSPESVKTLEITFSSPVTKLQFDIADIDSAPPFFTRERLTATVYDSSNNPLGDIEHLAPTSGSYGDAEVVNIDFGALSGIRKLYIEIDNVGSFPSATAYGWGLDNLQFDVASAMYLDIKPGSCPNPLNVKSKGKLPVAILGTEDLDVTEIDASTLLLNGVAPIRYNIEDVATPFNGVSSDDCFDCTENGPDGFEDFVLHFKTQHIIAAIDPVFDGDCVVIYLTGELLDGTPFEATDQVLVRSKNGNGQGQEPDECYGGVPKTGQTTLYETGDDGNLQNGIAWPVPRFTDNSDGTVTDNLTGLVWLKNANCDGEQNWYDALSFSNMLSSGACGLSDGSVAGDWRLPNIKELQSLIHYGVHDPALPEASGTGKWSEDDPFTGVLCDVTGCAQGYYWTSTTAEGSGDAFYVYLGGGFVRGLSKDHDGYNVWPVRNGY